MGIMEPGWGMEMTAEGNELLEIWERVKYGCRLRWEDILKFWKLKQKYDGLKRQIIKHDKTIAKLRDENKRLHNKYDTYISGIFTG